MSSSSFEVAYTATEQDTRKADVFEGQFSWVSNCCGQEVQVSVVEKENQEA